MLERWYSNMEKQKFKNVKVKGTVLFTVVSVMMVLIVFVMATLTIASAASKRSYNTYFKNQALYSARSVVDTTVKELLAGGASNDLKKEATKLVSAGDELELSCDLPTGMGKVSDLKIEFAGIDKIGEPSFVTGSGDGIIKITATVEMGGQASTYSQYVLKSAAVTIPAISEGGLVSMGTGLKSIGTTSANIKGTSYTFNAGNTGDVKDSWSDFKNAGSINAVNYNSSVYINTNMKGVLDKGTGIYVGGHLLMQNMPELTSKAVKGTDGLRYSEIPYIYVGGVLYKENPGNLTIGTKDSPINIYSGSLVQGDGGNGAVKTGITNFTTYGDVYAYDEYVNNSTLETLKPSEGNTKNAITGLTVFGDGGVNGGTLLSWVDSLVNKTDGNFASHTGGSFYSNGKLIINSASVFGGDVIVKGPVEINVTNNSNEKKDENGVEIIKEKTDKIIIDGSLYAGESLTITGSNSANYNKIDFKVYGGIFVGTGATVSIDPDVTINGVKYSGDPVAFIAAVNAAADATKVAATQAKIDNGKLFPPTMDKKYLFEGDTTLAEDEIAKTITLIDNQDIKKTFEATVNGITEYKDYKAKPEDAGDSYSRVYTSADKDYTESTPLTENCTLYGIWSEDIYIKPSAGQTMWITLADFDFASGKNIIVDNTTNPSNPGTVYFFVPEKGAVYYDASEQKLVDVSDGNVEITGDLTLNGNKIITRYYYDLETDEKDDPDKLINLTKYPTESKQIPNIFIYMAGGKKAYELNTDDKTSNDVEPEDIPTLKVANGTITGYICAPYITLDWAKARGVGGTDVSIKYDGESIANGTIAVIGQVIVGDIKAFDNDASLLQVSPNAAGGGGPRPGEVIDGQWTELENTYGFGS